ncbi:MAG: restriction endonuclease [Nitrososphaerota archaeon]|jgi:DNA modification methylase|nr:restriction endonuclease [Nitrososphaerota archaeon]MDG6927840.1 restriction endonuclease [Nitrososphaerota archaeon]MDG6931268.1 restriction endonuclease [Nitrososphaerota archaeon]MDG6932135.1 restriction endonuclease [Nitrososphaerota archaeon]MDG6936166.1 restriction endonuclease [Nitrososphaerota archaeon]
MENTLYYGDNLDILRKYIKDESIDLIYLDPPFNSKADYNILYKEPNGTQSVSQIQAFSDFWHWDEQAEKTYEYLLENPSVPERVKRLVRALYDFLGNNDMSAYLVMMAARLIELRRVLKDTGSIYLHCDPTASHYLKLVMDAVFSAKNFRAEIIWKRTFAHSNAKTYGGVHDIILFYSKGDNWTWNNQFQQYDQKYLSSHYNLKDKNGKYLQLTALIAPGKGYVYEWKGVTKNWRLPKESMEKLESEGRLYYTKNGTARYIRYLDEMPGTPLQDVWTDIPPINSQAKERLGYPTQKPLELLERIIKASSNEGDVVLDPFCGCGTALDAAEKLHRHWIGIDITHLAINVIRKRLKDRYPNVNFVTIGEPTDLAGARELAQNDRYQFQWWALALVDAVPFNEKKKGADTGIDGVIYNPARGIGKDYYGVVQVKSGHVNSAQIRDFKGTIEREKADYGIFITLEEPTRDMNTEAVTAGYFTSHWGDQIPKIQIITIESLLNGEKPKYPTPSQSYMKAKKADREKPDENFSRMDKFT